MDQAIFASTLFSSFSSMKKESDIGSPKSDKGGSTLSSFISRLGASFFTSLYSERISEKLFLGTYGFETRETVFSSFSSFSSISFFSSSVFSSLTKFSLTPPIMDQTTESEIGISSSFSIKKECSSTSSSFFSSLSSPSFFSSGITRGSFFLLSFTPSYSERISEKLFEGE